jgi:Protein of unknown function (DUF4065)
MPSRVAQLIRRIVERVPGCGRTRIVKLIYMADHEARRYLGRPLTDLCYRWDNYGPFDPEIQRQINYLMAEEQVEETVNTASGGYIYYQYSPIGHGIHSDLNREEAVVFDFIIDRFANMKLADLLDDVVYQTRPMTSATTRGERLKMDLVNGEERIPGVELENVIAGYEQIEKGQKKSLDEIMLSLQERD